MLLSPSYHHFLTDMDEGSYPKATATNPTALANNAIRSISFQEPQKAIQTAFRHLLSLIQEQQASTHEFDSQFNRLSVRIDVIEQKHLDDKQVQQAKHDELKRELHQGFQQRYVNNLEERIASSERDNHHLRKEIKMMDSRYGQELSAMRDTLNLLMHNLGFSPDSSDDDNNGDGSEKEQKDEEAAGEIAKVEGQHEVEYGKVEIANSKVPSLTIQSELRNTDREQTISKEEDDGCVYAPGKEEHSGETNETNDQSLRVPAVAPSEKGTIVSGDRIITESVDVANETNEDDESLNVEDIANGIDMTLPTTPLRPDAGQGTTNNTAVSKQTLTRPTQMNSASHWPSTVVLDASKTKLAFHETLVSRLERLEGTYDEILRKHHNGNDIAPIPPSKAECEMSANDSGPFNTIKGTKEDVLKLEIEIAAIKSRVDSTDAFLDGCIDASDKTEEMEIPSDDGNTAQATLSSILQKHNKTIQKEMEETNERLKTLSVEISSRLESHELELSQQSRGQSIFSEAKVEMDSISSRSHGNSVDDAVVSDLQQKMRLFGDRLDVQEAKLAHKSRNLPTASTDDGWKNQVDKSLFQLEKEKVDSSHLDSTVASLEDKYNQQYDVLANDISQLREDGFVFSNLSTGSEPSGGNDGRLQEALTSIEAAQTTIGSLRNELEDLISKLDDKPTLEQVKALLGSVESTYKDRFATHEALQSAIGDIHQGLKQKMTRSDVSNVISKAIEKTQLGLTKEKDSLMIGRAPYRCIGCNSIFPGVSNSIATKVNHNALPTPSIGFGRSLHAKRFFHVREDGDKRGTGGGGGGVIRTRRPRPSAGTTSIYARR